MEQWEWFIWGKPLGWYWNVRELRLLKKEDKELFDWMIEHFTERYKKLSDEGTEKEDFMEKVEDIFIDFFHGPQFWDEDDQATEPFWRGGGWREDWTWHWIEIYRERNKNSAIVPYKTYSYFDRDPRAIQWHRDRIKHRDSLLSEEDKKLVEKNRQKLAEIFSQFLPELLKKLDKNLR